MLTIKAYAKINLYLDVLRRLPDGYHQIESVMQSVSLHDTLELSMAPSISISCSNPSLANEHNLAFRAARSLQDATGVEQGATIYIHKRIPVAAGLAGGSADAAATLAGLNVVWDLGLSVGELARLGAKLGADVPFCLTGGTMLAEGIGERLTGLPAMPQCHIVIATPAIAVSTAEMYKAVDSSKAQSINKKEIFIAGLKTRDIAVIAGNLANIMEEAATERYPVISELLALGMAEGGTGARMSGSGPSVFILCETGACAERLAASISKSMPGTFTAVTEPVSSGTATEISSC